MPGRVTQPHPRVDAIRGCLALERGPLVYAIETADLPDGIELEDVTLAPDAEPASPWSGRTSDRASSGCEVPATTEGGRAFDLAAVPYHAWGNRAVEAMRVWIPQTDATRD